MQIARLLRPADNSKGHAELRRLAERFATGQFDEGCKESFPRKETRSSHPARDDDGTERDLRSSLRRTVQEQQEKLREAPASQVEPGIRLSNSSPWKRLRAWVSLVCVSGRSKRVHDV